MTTTITTTILDHHRLDFIERDGTRTYECVSHDWAIEARTDDDRRWAELCLADHVRKSPTFIRQRLETLFPSTVRPCHAICVDDDGHSDGCLHESDDR